MTYCGECLCVCNVRSMDYGIGRGEAHGRPFNDSNVQEVSDCCESTVVSLDDIYTKLDADEDFVPNGLYQHYKGELYVKTGTAFNSDASDKHGSPCPILITYYPVTGHDCRLCVRALATWVQATTWPSGEYQPRYTIVDVKGIKDLRKEG